MFKNYLILKYLIIGSTPNQAQEPYFKNNDGCFASLES